MTSSGARPGVTTPLLVLGRGVIPAILAIGVLAGCASVTSSQRMTVGYVCDRYAAAVPASLPGPLPPQVPHNFLAGLARSAYQDCVWFAATLGDGPRRLLHARMNAVPSSIRRSAMSHEQVMVLVHRLTDHTITRLTL